MGVPGKRMRERSSLEASNIPTHFSGQIRMPSDEADERSTACPARSPRPVHLEPQGEVEDQHNLSTFRYEIVVVAFSTRVLVDSARS